MRYRFFRIPALGDNRSFSDDKSRLPSEKRIQNVARTGGNVARFNQSVGFRQPREQGRARWLVQDPVGDPSVWATQVACAANGPFADSVLVGTPDGGSERSLSAPWGTR